MSINMDKILVVLVHHRFQSIVVKVESQKTQTALHRSKFRNTAQQHLVSRLIVPALAQQIFQ